MGRSRRPFWWLPIALAAILAVAVAARVPCLTSATRLFNSDEAVNALVIEHLIAGKELRLYPWEATYYGLVEGLLALPFVLVLGAQPLAFKLAAVVGQLLLMIATFLLARRLYGTAAGLAAAALLAFFSPKLVLWSTLATGGLVLVAAWGSFTLLWLDGLRRAPSRWGVVALGAMVGFGLYIYELYLIYLVVLAIAAVAASFAAKAVLAPSAEARSAALRSAPRDLGAAALFLAGVAVGWFPKLVTLLAGRPGTKAPLYAFAGPGRIAGNVELLASRCVPSLFGANPAAAPALEQWVGPTTAPTRVFGALLLGAWAVVLLWGLARTRFDLVSLLRRPPTAPGTEALLVLLVAVTAILFLASTNPVDVHADHYLLPWLSALPVLGGGLLARLATRHARLAAAVLALVLVGIPGFQLVTWCRDRGYVDDRLRIRRQHESLVSVLDYLRARGIRGGDSWYWAAYKATFLSREEIVIAPLWDWDRYPAYTRRVDALPSEAYLFEYITTPTGVQLDDRHGEFSRRLKAARVPYEVRRIGSFLVYTGAPGRRLFLHLGPLERPRAEVVVLTPPTDIEPGAVIDVEIRLTNRGGEPWSATGDAIGVFRVDLSYRWFEADGTPLVLVDGQRTLLAADLYPGESTRLPVRVPVPDAPGDYRLVLSPVQEGVSWFVDTGAGHAELMVHVGDGSAAGRRATSSTWYPSNLGKSQVAPSSRTSAMASRVLGSRGHANRNGIVDTVHRSTWNPAARVMSSSERTVKKVLCVRSRMPRSA